MEEKTSMLSDNKAPGYKRRRNKDGTIRHLWVARADIVKQGYTPKSVRLHYDDSTPEGKALIAAACQRLQAEMLASKAGYLGNRNKDDGLIGGLVRVYETHPASPHLRHKWNTRRNEVQVLGTIERSVGKRARASLHIEDFVRWHEHAAKPKKPGGPPRLRKAYGIIKMFREMFRFGVMAELPECARLAAILTPARFPHPGRRRVQLELAHVEAFITAAIERNRLSLALGTALQFELGVRQKDVIGEWEPCNDNTAAGILLNSRRWTNGLVWSDIGENLVIKKFTTKTGAAIAHDLSLCPLVMQILALIPKGVGLAPLIVDETCGRPYAEHAYAREWRIIARTAKIPDNVWNMDARAGAITEAEDAGAELDAIRSTVGHSNASTTARYSRGQTGKSSNVMKLRTAHRDAKKREVNKQ